MGCHEVKFFMKRMGNQHSKFKIEEWKIARKDDIYFEDKKKLYYYTKVGWDLII